MKARFTYLVPVFLLVCCCSCKDEPAKNHGPIRLGDTSTIVTENDPRKLQDLVTDLQPEIPPSKEDVPEAPSKTLDNDTSKKKPTVTPATEVNNLPGLTSAFEDVTVFIQNVSGKLAGNKNLQHANGAVYSLQSGNINGNILKVTGNVTKVSQRYQVVAIVKNNLGTLPLESLSTTTSWQPITGVNNQYHITGLDAKSLETPDANNQEIRKAVSKAAQRHHFSRKKIEEWVNSVHNVRAANQKPLTVSLRSVMWKIDGKDSKGKIFSKQIRVDLPL